MDSFDKKCLFAFVSLALTVIIAVTGFSNWQFRRQTTRPIRAIVHAAK